MTLRVREASLMISRINDSAFGDMQYKHNWYKTEEINFWHQDVQVRIIASASSGQGITEIQRENYLFFKSNTKDISSKSFNELKAYLLRVATDLQNSGMEQVSDDVLTKDIVLLKSVIFQKDGSFGLLCDFQWDIENGLAIQIKPEYKVGPQDILL